MEGDRQKCLDVGMDDYLSKPVSKGDLVRALQQHLPKSCRVEGAPHAEPSYEIHI
jgi:CheY-like chemotaxis protein